MTADEKIPMGWYGCRGTAGYGGDYWTAIVSRNRLFYYNQTENIRIFE